MFLYDYYDEVAKHRFSVKLPPPSLSRLLMIDDHETQLGHGRNRKHTENQSVGSRGRPSLARHTHALRLGGEAGVQRA